MVVNLYAHRIRILNIFNVLKLRQDFMKNIAVLFLILNKCLLTSYFMLYLCHALWIQEFKKNLSQVLRSLHTYALGNFKIRNC